LDVLSLGMIEIGSLRRAVSSGELSMVDGNNEDIVDLWDTYLASGAVWTGARWRDQEVCIERRGVIWIE